MRVPARASWPHSWPGWDLMSILATSSSRESPQKKIKFKKANLNENIPYGKNHFDYLVAIEVLEHLENTHHFIREARRVLKRGGELILTTPNITNIFSRIKFFLNGEFFTFGKRERESPRGHITPVPFWKLQQVLRENNFEILSLTGIAPIRLGAPPNGVTGLKRIISVICYNIFHPIVFPKDKQLLRGQSLIVKARKR
jgi:SAM-dependent methyltransferase